MSFLRHREIYQADYLLLKDDPLSLRERQLGYRSLAHRPDEFPAGYSWRVALQHCPIPLHKPPPIVRERSVDCKDFIRRNPGEHQFGMDNAQERA